MTGGAGVPVAGALARLREAVGPVRATRWRDRVRVLGRVGQRLLDADDPLHRAALEALPSDAGYSEPQARYVLEGMARDWTPLRLEALVRTEFADPDVLDRWIDDPRAPEGRRIRTYPLAPGPALHICAGSVPGVSVTSAIRGLLVGGPVLLKPGAGDSALPRVFVEGLRAEASVETAARALADALALARWQGGEGGADEEAALAGAGAVVVYGGSDTIADLRRRVPATTPLVAYGHRSGRVVVGPDPPAGAAAQVAGAVAAFDQRGCVSPHQVFVVGSPERATDFAAGVAEALGRLAVEVPRGEPTPRSASAMRQLRDTVELRRAAGEGVRAWGGDALEWGVVMDPLLELRPSCLGRTVHVTPIRDLDDLDPVLEPAGPHLQTVGISGFDEPAADALAERMGRLGACRIVPMDHVPFPPPWWLHDGRGPLRRLVRWCARGPA